MRLIAGLGNPGRQYDQTRHNVGWAVLDRLARRHAPGAAARCKFHGIVVEAAFGPDKAILLRPTTFMNRCGQAVAEAVRFYKLDPAADLLVIVDDTALPCGMIRLRCEGGAGGHNGLADIEQKLGSGQYARLRLGIDAPGGIPQETYVLGRFRPQQLELLEPALEDAVDATVCWMAHGIKEAMNRFNRRQTA
ncbi:MAG: aminoacyl-tRNA hydrolase [Planctomycetota bacterium]|jgi:PTH1 family peptidyl-tRNA hydrolase